MDALGFSLTLHPTQPYVNLIDGISVRPLKEAIKTAATLNTDAVVLFVAADDVDGRIEAIVEDVHSRAKMTMKPGLMPPQFADGAPVVARITIGPKATILSWRAPGEPPSQPAAVKRSKASVKAPVKTPVAPPAKPHFEKRPAADTPKTFALSAAEQALLDATEGLAF